MLRREGEKSPVGRSTETGRRIKAAFLCAVRAVPHPKRFIARDTDMPPGVGQQDLFLTRSLTMSLSDAHRELITGELTRSDDPFQLHHLIDSSTCTHPPRLQQTPCSHNAANRPLEGQFRRPSVRPGIPGTDHWRVMVNSSHSPFKSFELDPRCMD